MQAVATAAVAKAAAATAAAAAAAKASHQSASWMRRVLGCVGYEDCSNGFQFFFRTPPVGRAL